MQELEGSILQVDIAIASSYDSYDKMAEAFERGEFSAAAYNQALINLDKELDTANLDSEELEDYADHLQDVAKNVSGLSDELADNDDAAKIVAKSIMKMNAGIDDLADNYEDWADILENSTEGSAEFADAIDGMRKAVASLLDVSDEFVTNNFLKDNLEDIERAATGDEEAIDRLKAALLEDIVAKIVVDNQLDDFDLLGEVTNLQTLLDEMGPLEVGATVNDSGFVDACNQLIANAGLTASQVNALFDAMGFETKFAESDQPIKNVHPVTQTKTDVVGYTSGTATGPDGKPRNWEYPILNTTTDTIYEEVAEGTIGSFAMTTDGSTPVIESITKKATGSYNNYSSSNRGGGSPGKKSGGGGGGSGKEDKPKKKDETPLEEVLDRYHEINDQLDDITRATKKLNTETDRLYGAKKFANMDKEIGKLKEQTSLIEKKTKEAKNYLGTIDSGDMGALVDAAAGVGFTLDASNFDAAGNLLNVESIQRAMWDKLHEMEVTYNSLATGTEQDTYEEEVIKPWQDKIDEFERALKLYEDTRELIQDLEEEREEILREIEDIRFNKIVQEIEIKLDYKDAKKDINDLAKMIREAVGTAYDWGADSAKIDFENMQLEKSKMAEYQDEYQKLLDLYEESKTNPYISTDDIANQLEELRGQIIGSAEALVEWAESLEEILPDAIDAAREHFDQFIDQLEHNTTVIDTIKEIMVLQGLTYKTAQGFNDIQDIHKKRMDATLGQAKLNRAWYERAATQLQQAQAALDAASPGTQEYDILKANRDALLQEYNDAQEAMLESAKETMEEARDMYVDAVERTAYELEQTLTKGQGFDLLQDKYDHYLDTEERYLDTVNRIYETTTLNNKLQKELDKTTNAAGAQKLKDLQEEFKLR
ncbi:MAG: hypothetical protein NC218_07540 [Acetobacter sp.]|nr:hypothetical protein [Acetobacter sp.]